MAEGEWPDGKFYADAPDLVAYAADLAKRLAKALEGKNKLRIAENAGVDRTTLYAVLNGDRWADTMTMAKLERELGVSLWPTKPKPLGRVKAVRPQVPSTGRSASTAPAKPPKSA